MRRLSRPRLLPAAASRVRRTRRLGALALVATGALLATAPPAGAHSLGGVHATNYRTDVTSVEPPLEGVSIRAIEGGDRLELVNVSGRDVIVEGYDGEAYLRVGPRGVFENARSPARFLNEVRRDPPPPPPSADPDALPRWRRIDSGTTVRWHDHRAHWMGSSDPPVVEREPDVAHVIQRFVIVLHAGDDDISVSGRVRWFPAPRAWPWVVVAGALALATLGIARTRGARSALAVSPGLALAGAAAHGVGSWSASSVSLGGRVGAVLPVAAALVLCLVAWIRLARGGVRAAAPLLVFGGLFLGIAIGLADVATLTRSQLPTDLPADLDRLTVALTLGAGFGTAAGAAFFVGYRAAP